MSRASARWAHSSAPSSSSKYREGGDPSTTHESGGRIKYEAITLDRGVTHDVEFEQWANKAWTFGSGQGTEVSLKDFRKDLIIELCNEARQVVEAYKVFRDGASVYQAPPELDANANAVAIEHIKLENERSCATTPCPSLQSRPSSGLGRFVRRFSVHIIRR